MPVAIVLVIAGGMYLMGHTNIWEPANLGGLFCRPERNGPSIRRQLRARNQAQR